MARCRDQKLPMPVWCPPHVWCRRQRCDGGGFGRHSFEVWWRPRPYGSIRSVSPSGPKRETECHSELVPPVVLGGISRPDEPRRLRVPRGGIAQSAIKLMRAHISVEDSNYFEASLSVGAAVVPQSQAPRVALHQRRS